MKEKDYLMIPGPTYVAPRVLRALSAPMINHRGPEFAALFVEVTGGVKRVFRTENDVLIFPAAGTGGMEAAVTNLLSPGDHVLVGVMGVFGQRFAGIARAFGAEVEEIAVEWGKAVQPEEIRRRLERNPGIKAVIVTHNETSTGVSLDLQGVAGVVREYPALLVVDAVSSLGALPLFADEWGIDVVVAGSQKALMIPPGLALVSVSPAAWEAHASARMPRFYWDFSACRKSAEKSQNPYTPAVSLWYALRESLEMIEEEGLDNIYRRHALLGAMARAGVRALGLELLVEDEKAASNTVTAVKAPAGIEVKPLRKVMQDRFGVTIAGGQARLEGKIFRIGHLGAVRPMDVVATIAALEMSLRELDYPVELGAGVAAAQKVWLEGGKE